jgi:hypothetical protein
MNKKAAVKIGELSISPRAIGSMIRPNPNYSVNF